MEKVKDDYHDLIEKSEEKLMGNPNPTDKVTELETKASVEKETKLIQEKKMIDALSNQTKSITSSVDRILSEAKKMEDGCEGAAKVHSLKSDLHALDDKIDGVFSSLFNQYVSLLDVHEAQEKEDMRKLFLDTVKTRIDTLLLLLSMKVKDLVPDSISNANFKSARRRKRCFSRRLILLSSKVILLTLLIS